MWGYLLRQLGAGIGSGLIHLAGFVALIAGTMPNDTGDIFLHYGQWSIAPDLPKPLLVFTPAPLERSRLDSLIHEHKDRCATPHADTIPARLLNQPNRPATWRSPRDPRLCLRVGSDGRVLAARVLTSSQDGYVDRDAEALARSLRFVPAHLRGLAVASTVTYDALGNDRR